MNTSKTISETIPLHDDSTVVGFSYANDRVIEYMIRTKFGVLNRYQRINAREFVCSEIIFPDGSSIDMLEVTKL